MTLKLTSLGECPACQNKKGHQKLFTFEKFSLYQCGCGLKFIDPSLDNESMMNIYQSTEHLKQINPILDHYYEYETLAAHSRTYRDYKKALTELSYLTPGRKLLEAGCGRGSFLKVAKELSWQVTGLDSSATNINALGEQGIDGICDDFLSFRSNRTYDAVVLWDLIEHPQNPGDYLDKCFELLSKDGLVLIATPQDPSLLSILASWIHNLTQGKISGPLKRFYVLEHTSYFDVPVLKRLLTERRFNTIKFWKTETDIDRYQIVGLTKFFVEIAFIFARMLNLENRSILIAKKNDGD